MGQGGPRSCVLCSVSAFGAAGGGAGDGGGGERTRTPHAPLPGASICSKALLSAKAAWKTRAAGPASATRRVNLGGPTTHLEPQFPHLYDEPCWEGRTGDRVERADGCPRPCEPQCSAQVKD